MDNELRKWIASRMPQGPQYPIARKFLPDLRLLKIFEDKEEPYYISLITDKGKPVMGMRKRPGPSD